MGTTAHPCPRHFPPAFVMLYGIVVSQTCDVRSSLVVVGSGGVVVVVSGRVVAAFGDGDVM